ncbi:hypothetical protein N9R79_07765 [Vibrio sp.]|nr:hypothetical protein [Vibrio sp.]
MMEMQEQPVMKTLEQEQTKFDLESILKAVQTLQVNELKELQSEIGFLIKEEEQPVLTQEERDTIMSLFS